MANVESATEKYDEDKDADRIGEDIGYKDAVSDMHFKAGQSKRVWGELYKVLTQAAIAVISISNTLGSCDEHSASECLMSLRHSNFFLKIHYMLDVILITNI